MRRSQSTWSLMGAAAALALPAAVGVASVTPVLAGGMYEMVSHDYKLGIDQAKMLRIEGDAALVAVGNPSIADAIIHSSDTLLLIGRSYGATNVLVFDQDGNEMASVVVNVVDAAPHLLTVHRGAAQNSYNCAPDCQPVARIGDEEEFNKRSTQQAGDKFSLATSGAAASASSAAE